MAGLIVSQGSGLVAGGAVEILIPAAAIQTLGPDAVTVGAMLPSRPTAALINSP
ncbi:MAG: hypothetical protein M3336_12835 [Chloroflexota bacterium]|nr:hypothetical protein [Chloroflexota bacterium]